VDATVAVMLLAPIFGAHIPQDVAVEEVDLIEVNHYYDEHGRLVFDQLIFYDWCDRSGRFQVRAWRLLKKPEQMPRRNWRTGHYTAIWKDGDVLRKVRSKAISESWTQHDPELAERRHLAKEKRRDLLRISRLPE